MAFIGEMSKEMDRFVSRGPRSARIPRLKPEKTPEISNKTLLSAVRSGFSPATALQAAMCKI
jgi:hypothetical protein